MRDKKTDLEVEFQALAAQWKKDTFAMSSLTKAYAHPAYLRIMAMGTSGIPFLLREMQKNEGHWFYALKFMAGKNVSAGMQNFEDAKAAWSGDIKTTTFDLCEGLLLVAPIAGRI